MNSEQRREKIASILLASMQAVSASVLAEQLQVSRQVIVGDIALLRARGMHILSTPKGYILSVNLTNGETVFKIACNHNADSTRKEIYAIVDNGGTLLDVMVEHPIYGQLVGQLNISSRFDTDDFLLKVEKDRAGLLLNLTDGVHLHTISCRNEETMQRIKNALKESCVLLSGE